MAIFGSIVLGAVALFAGGLVVGWLFLPMPGFIKRIFGRT